MATTILLLTAIIDIDYLILSPNPIFQFCNLLTYFITKKCQVDGADWLEEMPNDPNHENIDEQIAYRNEMEAMAMGAGDYTKAEHHRKKSNLTRLRNK